MVQTIQYKSVFLAIYSLKMHETFYFFIVLLI